MDIKHYDGITESLEFCEDSWDEDIDSLLGLDDMDGDAGEKLLEFREDRKKWVPLLTTNRGYDNRFGILYYAPVQNCICAENSNDDIYYSWNVASDMTEVHTLIKEYATVVKKSGYDGGFVDWIMDRPGILPVAYCDLQYGANPYRGWDQN